MLIDKQNIKEVLQPKGSKLCSIACVAMVTGQTLDEVMRQANINDVDSYTGTYLKDKVKLCVLNNIYPKLIANSCMEYGYIYIAAVPSLTVRAGLHNIVIDLRDNECVIYDPNRENHPENNYSSFDPNQLPAAEIIQLLDVFNLPYTV